MEQFDWSEMTYYNIRESYLMLTKKNLDHYLWSFNDESQAVCKNSTQKEINMKVWFIMDLW